MASQKRAMCGICVADQSVYSSWAGRYCADHAPRLDRVRDQPLLAVALLDGDRRRVEDGVGAVARELPGVAVVRAELLVDDRRAVLERFLGVDDRGKLLVVHLDELGGVLRLRARLGDDDGDSVALVARLVRGERPVHGLLRVLGDEPDARERGRPVVGEVGAREGVDDALGLAGRRDVDALDRGVRERAADDRRPHHAGQRQVVDVAGLAGEELRVLLAGNGLPDVGLGLGDCHLPSPQAAAAVFTALTMFW